MCALFKNKYVIGSKRYRGFDYSSPGKYFITICTKNKIPYFGKIENGKMVLSEMGQITDKYWREIPMHFPFIELDEFIIMFTRSETKGKMLKLTKQGDMWNCLLSIRQ